MKKFIVIGSSAAGLTAATNLSTDNAEIVCLTNETCLPYNKCFLIDFISGKKNLEQIKLAVPKNIKFIYEKAIGLDSEKKIVVTEQSTLSYDKLLIACGSSTYIPNSFENILKLKNVFLFNDLGDTVRLKNYLEKFKPINCVVIGAGITGLEIANAINQKNINVTIIEKNKICQPLHGNLAANIKALLEKQNITLLEDCTNLNFDINDELIHSVITKQTRIEADLVICTTGTKPNTDWLKNSNINLKNGYIVTDDFLMTNVKDVFAAGDCAFVKNVVINEYTKSYLWADATMQAFVATNNMLHKSTRYNGFFPNIITNLSSQNVIICGDCGIGKIMNEENAESKYKAIFLNDEQRIAGYCSISNDNINEVGKFKSYILQNKTYEKENTD